MTYGQYVAAKFLSTLPARGATNELAQTKHRIFNFYPRSPRGERRTMSCKLPPAIQFLSTLPARGATAYMPHLQKEIEDISIHAPREGSDAGHDGSRVLLDRFLSTLPARGATLYGDNFRHHFWISIHAPREGSDKSS